MKMCDNLPLPGLEPMESALTLSAAGSRAKTSALPEKAQESTENAAECGGTWRESSVRYDRDTSSWKTHRCLFTEVLPESSVTLPRWGMTRDGVCWERSMPELRTSGIDSGSLLPTPLASNTKAVHLRSNGRPARSYLPTPTATENMLCPSMQKWSSHRNLWPTPTRDSATERSARYAQGGMPLTLAVKMWPTPTAQDAKNNGAPSQMDRNTKPLNAEIGGALNPTWVEWLMGWPLGWTDCAASETDRFQQWLRSHGECSEVIDETP